MLNYSFKGGKYYYNPAFWCECENTFVLIKEGKSVNILINVKLRLPSGGCDLAFS